MEGQGAGQVGGKGVGVCERAILYAAIMPLATGTPGRIDTNGHNMHFRYTGNIFKPGHPRWRPNNQDPTAIDYVSSDMVVEFDAMSRFVVPFNGTIEIVGGLGDYTAWVYQYGSVRDLDAYEPMVHTLRTWKEAGTNFLVPDNHHGVMGSNTGDQFVLPTLDLLEPSIVLPGSPILPRTKLGFIKSTTIITYWVG